MWNFPFPLSSFWNEIKIISTDQYISLNQIHPPELNEERQGWERYEDAVDECISEEKNEELVVGKSYAVVDPWAMMIHFSDTNTTNTAVVASIWLDMYTFLTVSHCKSAKWQSNQRNLLAFLTILPLWGFLVITGKLLASCSNICLWASCVVAWSSRSISAEDSLNCTW